MVSVKYINLEALSTRQTVQTISSLNLFIPFALALENLAMPLFTYSIYDTLMLLFLLVNCISQLFISARFNDENVIQRKIAIFLTVLKILILICIKTVQIIQNRSNSSERNIEYIATVDVLIVSSYMIYCLYKDLRLFGSGLKEYFRYGSKRMILSEKGE